MVCLNLKISNMHSFIKHFLVCLGVFFWVFIADAVSQNYPTTAQIQKQLEELSRSATSKVTIHNVAVSPGGHTVWVAEIGTEAKAKNKTKPAIFVMANPEGLHPLASHAALKLANDLLKNEAAMAFTWYVLPVLNPDAHERYFQPVKWENPRNAMKVNDDQDDAVDEDGPNDLNGDGFITQMRVKDPQGIWIIDETDNRLMRRADASKGEKGIYKLYLEGIDNDGDGAYNEDPPGGVNTGINFPHLFRSFSSTAGAWPGSTPEVYGMMRFIFDRPEIAATFTFGSTNFCLIPPEGGRRGSVDFNKITIPDYMVEMVGAEKGRTYTMDEIIVMAQPLAPPGIELTPSIVASFLGLGAVVNPLPEDLTWYKHLSEQYLDYLKKSGFNTERLEPEKAKDGSFELWSYYHLGVPTFSFNFFTPPKPKEDKKEGSGISPEQLENMSTEDFINLGEEKIALFLKEQNAPEQFGATRVIEMVKSGQTNPKQIAGMLKSIPKPVKASEADPALKALLAYSDKELGGKGFVNWKSYTHPTLGEVEIGGAVPFVASTPPFAQADSLIQAQLPWIFTLAEKLPRLKILDYKVKNMGAGVYGLEIWVENPYYLPYPTAMGKRNSQPAPAVLILEADGLEFLNGYRRTPIRAVDGLSSVKLSFLLKLQKGNTLKATLESKSVGNDFKEIKL